MAGRRLVVGIDGSAGSLEALRWALDAAGDDGATVEAVAAWTYPAAAAAPWLPTPPLDERTLLAEYEAGLQTAVESVATAAGADVKLRVVEGSAGPTLVQESAGADLLVVGRRGHGGFVGLLLGSVADFALRHAEVPLALVPPAGRPEPAAVVAGVDGSAHAAPALRWAAAEADRRGVPLVALYAWSWLDQPGEFDAAFDEEAASRYAAGVVAEVFGDREVEVVVVNDLPASALMARSAAGDLVVVGSRGMGAIRQAVVGSVSRELAHHAPSTVVVVRDQAT